jgi:creatinine amidohydrolase/Fe(II)-dependent formamide hydrolase-like protein
MRSAAIDKNTAIVFLPTAATEQHGAHLPVGTDSIILSTLIDRFIETERFDDGSLIFALQLYIGKSNEHMGFAGRYDKPFTFILYWTQLLVLRGMDRDRRRRSYRADTLRRSFAGAKAEENTDDHPGN